VPITTYFRGNNNAVIPDNICGSYCLWDEVHLSDKGRFELNILMDGPEQFLNLSEFRI
jgi:hypothetical protein